MTRIGIQGNRKSSSQYSGSSIRAKGVTVKCLARRRTTLRAGGQSTPVRPWHRIALRRPRQAIEMIGACLTERVSSEVLLAVDKDAGLVIRSGAHRPDGGIW
jgi:hypothetical protein